MRIKVRRRGLYGPRYKGKQNKIWSRNFLQKKPKRRKK